MPHVAPHFRGLTVTANLHLREPTTIDAVRAHYADRYADEPLLRVDDDAPWVRRIARRHGPEVGGFTLSADGHRLVGVDTRDNLLKGAAPQPLQHRHLPFRFPAHQDI